MPRNLRWPVIALIAGAVGLAIPMVAVADNAPTNNKTFVYQVGLWGDLPYSAVQANPGVPNLIADMNSQDLAFSVHDGDLKAGNGPPGNPAVRQLRQRALRQRPRRTSTQLDAPAMFTPGDNDWTDCDRPVERRLQLARAARPRTAGLLQHAVLGRPEADAAGGAEHAVVPGLRERAGHGPDGDQAGRLRREPAVDVQERHVRHAERPRLVQQPVRHRAEPRRGGGSERGRHRVAARHVRRRRRRTAPPLS